jgi:predicted DNA-binding antitoxin AbrB/MazE fold protein
MNQTLEAVFDGVVFRPDKTVELQPNTRVQIVVTTKSAAERKSQTLGELIDDCFKNVPSAVMEKLPEDASLNLDHYLYNAPKK